MAYGVIGRIGLGQDRRGSVEWSYHQMGEDMAHGHPCSPRGAWGVLLMIFCAVGGIASAAAAELTRSEIEQRIARAGGNRLDLGNADLSGLDLSGLRLAKADFFSSNLAGADLSGALLAEANFTRADLRRAKFSKADLRGAILYAALLEECDFSNADLSRARIIGGGPRASFKNAKLVGADLGADPTNQGMVPVRAELPEADFNGADLTGANFTHAILSSAKFEGAVMTGARFDYAVTDGTILRATEHLER